MMCDNAKESHMVKQGMKHRNHQRGPYKVSRPHQIEGIDDEKVNAARGDGTALEVCKAQHGRSERQWRATALIPQEKRKSTPCLW